VKVETTPEAKNGNLKRRVSGRQVRAAARGVDARDGGVARSHVVQESRRPLSRAFFGIWKENPTLESERSVTFERKADGIHETSFPQGFECDGKDYATNLPHTTVTCNKTGPSAYELTTKRDGKPTMIATRVISADGNVMTVVGVSPETGTGTRTTSIWNRVGRSSDQEDPLIGTWKMDPKSVTTDPPTRSIIEEWGDGISESYGIPGQAVLEFAAKFDGKDYAFLPGKSSGSLTVSLKQVDELAFVGSVKMLGQPFATLEYLLSADGKKLKKTFTLVSKEAPLTSVMWFDKQ